MIERGHEQDRSDVRSMIEDELAEPRRLMELFEAIEPKLPCSPALAPATFRAAVERAIEEAKGS